MVNDATDHGVGAGPFLDLHGPHLIVPRMSCACAPFISGGDDERGLG